MNSTKPIHNSLWRQSLITDINISIISIFPSFLLSSFLPFFLFLFQQNKILSLTRGMGDLFATLYLYVLRYELTFLFLSLIVSNPRFSSPTQSKTSISTRKVQLDQHAIPQSALRRRRYSSRSLRLWLSALQWQL